MMKGEGMNLNSNRRIEETLGKLFVNLKKVIKLIFFVESNRNPSQYWLVISQLKNLFLRIRCKRNLISSGSLT